MNAAQVALRPMTESEFTTWRAESAKNYVSELIRAGASEADAVAQMEKSGPTYLPEGVHTPSQHLHTLTLAGDGTAIGILWWGPQKGTTLKLAWIYDIHLQPLFRAKGLGKQALRLAEAEAKKHGYEQLGLHVFGHNEIARRLYEGLGFRVTSLWMRKAL